MLNYYEQGKFSVRAHLRDHERLDLAGMGDMGADTKVYHRPAAVYGSGGSVGNLGLDDIFLVLVVLCQHVRMPDRGSFEAGNER